MLIPTSFSNNTDMSSKEYTHNYSNNDTYCNCGRTWDEYDTCDLECCLKKPIPNKPNKNNKQK